MNTDHMAVLRRQIRALENKAPLAPWKKVGAYAVGGLEMVGYADNSDWLLVVSSQGRGLFDCATGHRIARDTDNSASWYDPNRLCALGIGPLDGQIVRLAGLYGGGLSNSTRDGWSLSVVAPTWPDCRVILCPPFISFYYGLQACAQIEGDYEIRAHGFSETGHSFVVALNHTLHIYAR